MRTLIWAPLAVAAACVLWAGAAMAELRADAVPAEWSRPQCRAYRILGVAGGNVDLFDFAHRQVGQASRADVLAAGEAVSCFDEHEYALVTFANRAVLVRLDAVRLDLPTAGFHADRDDQEHAARGEQESDRRTSPPPASPPSQPVQPQPNDQFGGLENGFGRGAEDNVASQIARDRVLTPALAELLPTEERTPRNGGSAVILLADPGRNSTTVRNLILCRALFRTFDQATSAEVRRGARIGGEGEVQLLRPIYWLTRNAVSAQPGADRCPARLQSYDYPRRDRIARKLNLRGAGPYLAIEQYSPSQTERVAAIIDLSHTPNGQIGNAVTYFRDGFMQAGDVWRPDRYAPARARGLIAEYFGAHGGGSASGFLPQLLHVAGAVACPLTNLLDVCSDTN
jgi:hypothetical protein